MSLFQVVQSILQTYQSAILLLRVEQLTVLLLVVHLHQRVNLLRLLIQA